MIRIFLSTFILAVLLVGCHQKQNTHVFNIIDYGAKGDSVSLNTIPIQKAIDACSANGGGVVLFPPGKFTTGTLRLKSNIEYRFLPGSVLIGSARLEDYNTPQGDHNIMLITNRPQREVLRVLLDGTDVHHITFSGKGIIEGNGNYFWDAEFNALERPVPWISFRGASFITIKDLIFQNAPSHVLRFEDSEQVIIDGVHINNHRQSPNTDGIDLVDSKNIFISNSYIETGDDAICLKTDSGGIVENVVVTNCILESDDAAIKFGTGSAGVARNCIFNNINIKNSRYGISLFMLEGGLFESISFSHITISEGSRHKHEYPIFIDIDKKRPNDQYGVIRNINFSDFIINSGGKILITGRPEQPIQNLEFKNILFNIGSEKDFSKANKPRGNKNFPKLPESIDRASVPAHITLGYIQDIRITGSSIRAASNSKRKDIDLIGVANMILDNNFGRHLSKMK